MTEENTTLKLCTVTMHTALQREHATKHGPEVPI
jgi:hypothetical protein